MLMAFPWTPKALKNFDNLPPLLLQSYHWLPLPHHHCILILAASHMLLAISTTQLLTFQGSTLVLLHCMTMTDCYESKRGKVIKPFV